MRAMTASWLWTGEAEAAPIAEGAVVFDERARVVGVGPLAELRARFPSLRFEQHAAVLMPGLVNAHTHLELSGLRGAVPGGRGFAAWVDGLMRLRAQRQPEQDAEAIDLAVSELLAAGVVAVGEVCNQLHTVAALASVPLVACVFHEVFGLSEVVAQERLQAARVERAAYANFPSHVRYALAPHTPYTLHGDVLQHIVRGAAEQGVRTSLHLAEHAAERTLLTSGQGPFADWIRARGISTEGWIAPGQDAVHYADALGVLGPQLLAVHLTDARPDELAVVAARGCAVALCPRSNLHIELKLPPLLDILGAGLRPGLGTDSLASNTSLDPLAEARALQKRFPTVPPAQLLAMATSWGAEALGVADQVGRLAPELQPGLLAFEHGPTPPKDPLRFVLDAERAPRHVLMRPRPAAA